MFDEYNYILKEQFCQGLIVFDVELQFFVKQMEFVLKKMIFFEVKLLHLHKKCGKM